MRLALAVPAGAMVCAAYLGPATAAETPAPFRDCPECPEMIIVPAGAFLMGAPGPGASRAEAHPVNVKIAKPFALGRFEITRKEYADFVLDADYETGEGCATWSETLTRFMDDRSRTWDNPGRPRAARPDHPVSCISWTDAKAYAAWLAHKTGKKYRLPSEAEWEYAARAGSSTRFPWGNGPDDGCAWANLYDLTTREVYPLGADPAHCRDGAADVAAVGTLKPNAFGLFDMIGNVAEWVEDCYTDSYVGRPRDGRAWVWLGGCQRHGQRGGSWLSPPLAAQPGHRDSAEANARGDWVGMRIARDLQPAEVPH